MRLWLCISVYSPRRGYFVAVFDNITERKRAEEQLRTSHERLKLAQQAANAGLWDWDVLTGKLTWSEELYKLFGMPPAAEASFDDVAGRRTSRRSATSDGSDPARQRETATPSKRVPSPSSRRQGAVA